MVIDDIKSNQNGDREATLRLVEKFNPILKKYAYMLHYEDAYNDLLVDFILLLKNMRVECIQNRGDGGFVSYICKSMYSCYIKRSKELKKMQVVIPYSELTESELYYLEGKTSSRDKYDIENSDILPAALTSSEKKVIKMVYFFGYSVSEVSSIIGVSRQAVDQMRRKGLNKIKSCW